MDKNVMVVLIVGFLGLLATALCFAAEAKRIKESQIRYTSSYECTYPGSSALTLGLTAVIVLSIAQTIIIVTTACLCFRGEPYQSNCSWTAALLCTALSWFTYVVAVFILTSAVFNDENGHHFCYVVKPGLFATAAFLSLCAVVFGILSYITVQSAKNRGDPWARPAATEQPGIAMGQPQFPQQTSQEPVFVHDDTFMRRQIA